MEPSLDIKYLDAIKDSIENTCNQSTLFMNFKNIFKPFSHVHSKNQYWRQNLNSFLMYIDNSQEPQINLQPAQIFEKRNKVKIGKAFTKEVLIDDIQEAQIFVGPNPNVIQNSSSPFVEIDSKILGRVNENNKKGCKIEFIDEKNEVFFRFKPKKNLEFSVCKFGDDEIKVTFVNKNFLIQALPNSGRSYICLFESQIIPSQIYQVGMTSIITHYVDGKFELTYFTKQGNKYKEVIEKETFIYIEGDNLTMEKSLDSEPALKISQRKNKWFIESLGNERSLFRSLHNLETLKLSKSTIIDSKESYPLLLQNDMLMNVNSTYFKVLKESEDDQ